MSETVNGLSEALDEDALLAAAGNTYLRGLQNELALQELHGRDEKAKEIRAEIARAEAAEKRSAAPGGKPRGRRSAQSATA